MNLAIANDMFMVLRVLHAFAGAFMVGASLFYFCLVRPSLALVPPAHGLVITRRLGILLAYLGWAALGLLLATGLLRLYLRDNLGVFLSLELFTQSHYRALALMTIAWFLLAAVATMMLPILRSRLAKSPGSNAAAGEGQNPTQAACRRLNLLHLLLAILSSLALLAGFSMVDGGLF